MTLPLTRIRAPRSSRSGRRSRATLPALCLAVLSFLLTQTLVIPVLPKLGESLSVSPTALGWIVTTNLLFGAVLVPIMGLLGDRFGHRRVLLLALTVMTMASVLAALSPNLIALLVARAIQAVGTGTFPLALTIVQFNFSGESQRSAVGWLSGVLGLGSAVALISGGLIADVFGWRGLFGTMAVAGLLALVASILFVPDTAEWNRKTDPIDWAGTALFVLALSSLLLGISQGSTFGWSSWQTAITFLVAAAGMTALVLVELKLPNPLLDIRILVLGNLGVVNALAFLLGFVSFLFYIVVPAIMLGSRQTGGGMDIPVIEATLYMVPNAVAVFAGGRIAATLVRKYGDRATAVLAMICLFIGAVGMACGHDSVWPIMWSYVAVGSGIGIGFSCCSQFVPTLVPTGRIATALGINTMIRTVGQASGTPVATTFLTSVALTDQRVVTSTTYAILFTFAAVVSGLGALMCLLIRQSKNS
ncbi:MAG: MFS transporter [Rhodococcus sp. (in: high G+C Gram-positive bacteria)]|nr:MAG: MFS transporter [Rhodococcus sp. (in: high G+C Gram-positive bacteria)]